MRLPDWVQVRAGYPFARWFAAFDFCLSAAGYNSFAELLAHRLPTIFVPNDHPSMDRQDLRARYAHRNGLGLHLGLHDRGGIKAALALMRDPANRAAMAVRLAALPQATGAAEAASLVQHLAESGLAHRPGIWL
jgi:UDP-N-acetylglucosamine:LPS N-acetylglucosamine transferase